VSKQSAFDIRHSAILLLGPTGSGKTPLGEWLERTGLWGRRCFHFDFGANLRLVAEKGNAALTDRELKIVRDSLETGALLENENFPIAGKILRGFAETRGVKAGDLLVLNGMPRHAGQAKDVDRIVDLQAVVVLECSAEVAWERIRVNAGGDRAGRADDSPAAVKEKLRIFAERTRPLLDHYRAKRVRVQTVRVGLTTGPAEIVTLIEKRPGRP
jgi:adenylate kinase family enzyme